MSDNNTPFSLIALTLAAALFLSGLDSAPAAAADRITGSTDATRSAVIAARGMVATSQPLATQVGLQVLREGGNAIDAAIAANAALGLMEPTGCGIGGDLYAIVWSAADKRLFGLNASGRSPLGLSFRALKKELRALQREDLPPFGLLPISVPGTVDGWFMLHERFGKLPMSRLLAPSIDYAEQGFPVTELIAYYWGRRLDIYSRQPGAFVDTFTIDGRAPATGELFRNPDLANTYRLLASGGRDAFYRGEIATKIDAFMRREGGYIRKRDLEQHTSEWVEPMSVNYRGYDVWELPPNGQGIAALQMLNILEAYDLRAMGHNSPELLHTLIEAKKLVFEDRAKFYYDAAFASQPLAGLLSKDYAAQRRKLIGPRAAERVDAGNPNLYQGDTIYLTTADAAGNMVSLIQSNYRGMGSGVVVPGLGFGLQDRGQMFSMDPKHNNVYAPGKRPFHTIIPAFVTKDGEPVMSFGLMGGAMQPQGHVQILVNIIDFGMNLQAAGDAPRWQHFGSSEPTQSAAAYLSDGGRVALESGIPYDTVRGLLQRGHRVEYDHGGYGGYQAIWYDRRQRVYYGASESRKDGQAAGF
ncbi:gamma-glutamyltransferase [Exilibacterium tricleocarpae]|uniref:Glutathione hydrolase proenzyme n=1 Tax=Exilibacterium tricleocarpae TaxID=2591008 RepID=A0A545TLZ9_9GAMM|nr:gamma-glutamyltransferase [Exilibacterium tricleocarpae]TQV78206.1 gamma-glutamyltransferase [Exilibacterium tricleocarpae]